MKEIFTVHVNLLAQLYQLHLCWHVSHCPHAVPQVFAANEPIFVFVELLESLTQLWGIRKFREVIKLIAKIHFCVCLWSNISQHTIQFLWPQLSILWRTKAQGQRPNCADIFKRQSQDPAFLKQHDTVKGRTATSSSCQPLSVASNLTGRAHQREHKVKKTCWVLAVISTNLGCICHMDEKKVAFKEPACFYFNSHKRRENCKIASLCVLY